MYLRKLGLTAAESNLARYGHVMFESHPDEVTQLLIDLCTNKGLLMLEICDLPTEYTWTLPTAFSHNAWIRSKCLSTYLPILEEPMHLDKYNDTKAMLHHISLIDPSSNRHAP